MNATKKPQIIRSEFPEGAVRFFAAIFGFILIIGTNSYAKESIPFYYASSLPAKERQDMIKEKVGKDDFDVLVFAKFKDFIEEVKGKDSSIVVAPSFFKKYYKDYKPILRFMGEGGKQFKYLLLSLNKEWNAKNLNNGKIGAVEEVDRDFLKDHLNELFKAKFKMVKSVSKPEDLFPLLVFKSADFILISPENNKALKEKFSTQVYPVIESTAVDYPMVFIKEGKEGTELIAKLKGMPQDVLKGIGFSKIEEVGKGL